MSVNSCSMPNSGSCFLYLLAVLTAAARVLVGCGLPSTRYTSHIDEHVVATTDRVRVTGDRLEHAVALVAGRLVRARTVETPDRKFAAVFDDLRLRSKLRRRLRAVDPDVLSLVDHCCPQSFQGITRGRTTSEGRPSDCVRNRRSVPLPSGCSVVNGALIRQRTCFVRLTTTGPASRFLHPDDRQDRQPPDRAALGRSNGDSVA